MSEVLGNKDYRVDSQFWTTVITKNQQYKYVKIGDALKQTQYGISLDMNEDGIGYPIYRMNEIHNSICDLDVKKYADITAQELSVFILQNGDVLFNRTNSYEWVGRTGIYYKAHEQEQKVFASYLVRLIPDTELILPEYLTAFLNTSLGIRQIKARARQSINQTNVNPEEVKEIEIPLLSKSLQTAIQCNYKTAHKNLISAKTLYQQAEELLNEYLRIGDISQEKAYTVKTLSKSFKQSGRLDAEYYQPKYDIVENRIRSLPHKKLKDIATVETGNFIEESFYGNEGLSYIRGTDIVDKTINFDIAIKVNIKPDKYKVLRKKDLAFALIGSVGNVSINEDSELALVSNNLGTISLFDKTYANYVLLFLSCPIGQTLFEKYQTRTAQPKINKKDIEQLIIPIIDKDKMDLISEKVQESFRLRKESKRVLNRAIKAVEMAIETDEETALQWLKEQE